MKKIYIVFIMVLFLFTSCSLKGSSVGGNNTVSSYSTESIVAEEDTVLSNQLNISDYAQFNAQYSTLIDRARMAINISNSDAFLNRNYVIQPDGSLWTWGIAVASGNTPEPRAMKLMDDVVAYSSSRDNVLAVKSDGSLWLWELDWPLFQVGPSNGSYDEAIHVMDDVVSVSSCGTYVMAIDSSGNLWAWGQNNWGQLGDGTNEDRNEPVKIMDNVASVHTTPSHAMAIRYDGSLWCWGENSLGQLGDGTDKNRNKPVKIMDDVVAVADDGGTPVALRSDGSLWAWGCYGSTFETAEMLDKEYKYKYYTPVKVFDDVISFSIAGTDEFDMMVVKSDGSLWGWGGNSYRQLVNCNERFSAEPVHIMDDMVYVSAFNDQYVMAVGADDSIWIWGNAYCDGVPDSVTESYILITPYCLDLSNLPGLGAQIVDGSGVPDVDISDESIIYFLGYREYLLAGLLGSSRGKLDEFFGAPTGGTLVDGSLLYGGTKYHEYRNGEMYAIMSEETETVAEITVTTDVAKLNGDALDLTREEIKELFGEPSHEDVNYDESGEEYGYVLEYILAEDGLYLSFWFPDMNTEAYDLTIGWYSEY